MKRGIGLEQQFSNALGFRLVYLSSTPAGLALQYREYGSITVTTVFHVDLEDREQRGVFNSVPTLYFSVV
jgi:hypothetical protein